MITSNLLLQTNCDDFVLLLMVMAFVPSRRLVNVWGEVHGKAGPFPT